MKLIITKITKPKVVLKEIEERYPDVGWGGSDRKPTITISIEGNAKELFIEDNVLTYSSINGTHMGSGYQDYTLIAQDEFLEEEALASKSHTNIYKSLTQNIMTTLSQKLKRAVRSTEDKQLVELEVLDDNLRLTEDGTVEFINWLFKENKPNFVASKGMQAAIKDLKK